MREQESARPQEPTRLPGGNSAGFTVIELLVSVLIVGILAAISINVYGGALEKARITRAIAEIRSLEKAITDREVLSELPASLDEIGWGGTLDPWGSAYVYHPFERNAEGKLDTSKARKDRFLVPLNSTYDLYSNGPDGESRPPLPARPSRDDIVRAGDGAFVGIAEDF